jgi:hypothetical protein
MKKEIRFHRHARRRMKWRRISEREAKETLQFPDRTEADTNGRINAYKKFGNRRLRITYIDLPEHALVITAVDKND